MTANRTSTSLVRFLGAEVSARRTGGGISNVFKNNRGGEQAPPAGAQRIFDTNLTPASLDSGQYEAALAHIERTGAAPLAAKAMALVLVDAAKAQNISVMRLIEQADTEDLRLVSKAAYTFINQLRDLNSQLSGSRTINNNQSLRARYLLA